MKKCSAEIKDTWVLLDTCATNSVLNNTALMKDIVACKQHERLTVSTNRGLINFDKKSTLKLLPIKVHFNKNSMDNILSFKEVTDIPGVRITTDTEKERAMELSLGNGRTLKFKECESGLYFHDTEKETNNVEEINNINGDVIDYSYLQTVQENKNFLTKEEVARASKYRIYQSILCWTSTTNYIKMLENSMITSCDINTDNIKRADTIWGPAESVLQGKMKRKRPNTHNKIPKLAIPLSVSQQHKQITMYIDIFYVNQIPFFLSKTGKLNFLSGTKV